MRETSKQTFWNTVNNLACAISKAKFGVDIKSDEQMINIICRTVEDLGGEVRYLSYLKERGLKESLLIALDDHQIVIRVYRIGKNFRLQYWDTTTWNGRD